MTNPLPITLEKSIDFESYCDPDNFQAVLYKLDRVLRYSQGLACVLGDTGYGKTTLCHRLHTEYGASDDYILQMIAKPDVASEFVFLKQICAGFQLPLHRNWLDQSNELRKFLLTQNQERKKVVLFIDEADVLKVKHLEILKMLLNWETDTEKVINLVLFGSEAFRRLLQKPPSRAFASRIMAFIKLTPAMRAQM